MAGAVLGEPGRRVRRHAEERRPDAVVDLIAARHRCSDRSRRRDPPAARPAPPSSATVAAATPAQVPRQPACTAATARPCRSAMRIGTQSATRTAIARDGSVETIASASVTPATASPGRHDAARRVRAPASRVTTPSAATPSAAPTRSKSSPAESPRNESSRVVKTDAPHSGESARADRDRPAGPSTQSNPLGNRSRHVAAVTRALRQLAGVILARAPPALDAASPATA